MKKIISILLVCAMVTGCSARSEYGSSDLVDEPTVSSTEDSSSDETSSVKGESSSTANTASIASSANTTSTSTVKSESSSVKESTSSVESTVSTVISSKIDNTGTREENSTVISTTTTPAPSVPVVEEPTWTEQAMNSVWYVSKEGIYSRKDAIVGSTAVKKYSLNDKVTVVAVTDTDYYKLEDGSFIHKDYLSDKETVISKPVEVEKPVTPSKPNVSEVAVSADAERLLNNASLNPMKTNESDLDASVEDILGQITNGNMSTCQKVMAIYDYIIKNSTYGNPSTVYNSESNYHMAFDSVISSRAYTLLMNKRGKCSDYASLFVVMTRRIGLESYVVSGEVKAKAGGMTGHTWSIMKLNGQYYIFDPQVEQDNTSGGQIPHTYFCRTESSLSSVYTYGVSGDIEMCALAYTGEPFSADNARDFTIMFFGNFVVDEGERPYNIRIAYWG